jgi:hypothetical protein
MPLKPVITQPEPDIWWDGVGWGFLAGLMANIILWIATTLLWMIATSLLPMRTSPRSPGLYMFAIGVAQLGVDSLLIWGAFANQRKSFGKGVIIVAALFFLFDSACGLLLSAFGR